MQWLARLAASAVALGAIPTVTAAGEADLCVDTTTVAILAPLPTNANLNGVEVWLDEADQVHFAIAGDDGALFVSDDAGLAFREVALDDEAIDWRTVHRTAAGTLIAGSTDHLAISEDGGTIWRLEPRPGTARGPIVALDRVLVAAPIADLAAVSDDLGATWTSLPSGLPLRLDGASTAQGGSVFAVGRSGLARSDDLGTTWQPAPLDGAPWLHAIAFDHTGTGIAVGNGIALRTRDAGATWTPLALDERGAFVDVAMPGEETVHVLVDDGAVWSSTDHGESFNLVELPDGDLRAMAFADPLRGFVVGAAGTILATDDAGATWTQLRRGTGRTLRGLARLDGHWLAGGAGGVRLVSDDGETWGAFESEQVPPIYAIDGRGDFAVAIQQNAVGIVENGSDGLAWTLAETGAAAFTTALDQVAALDDGQLFAALDGVLFRVTTTGELQSLDPGSGRVERLDAWGQTLFVAMADGVVTTQNGSTFAPLGPPGLRVGALAGVSETAALARVEGAIVRLEPERASVVALETTFAPTVGVHHPDGALFAGAGGVIVAVDDAGAATVGQAPAADVADLLVTDEHVWLLGGTGHIWRSMHVPGTWSEVAGPWPDRGDAEDARLGRDPTAHGALARLPDGRILAVGAHGHARRIEDAEVTELGRLVPADLTALHVVGDTTYAGGDGRTVIVSDDGGDTWRHITDDLAPERIVGIRFAADGRGVVATADGALYRFGDDRESFTYTLLRRGAGPLRNLGRDDRAGMWFVDGDGALLRSRDEGTTWDTVAATALASGVVAIDPELGTSWFAGTGQLLSLDHATATARSLLPAIAPRSRLFSSNGVAEALLVSDDGAASLLGSDLRALCTTLPGVMAAEGDGDGWLVVGQGGLIARISTDG